MEFAVTTPEMIADAMVDVLEAPVNFKPVEVEAAMRAACAQKGIAIPEL